MSLCLRSRGARGSHRRAARRRGARSSTASTTRRRARCLRRRHRRCRRLRRRGYRIVTFKSRAPTVLFWCPGTGSAGFPTMRCTRRRWSVEPRTATPSISPPVPDHRSTRDKHHDHERRIDPLSRTARTDGRRHDGLRSHEHLLDPVRFHDHLDAGLGALVQARMVGRVRAWRGQDRKSTRLNSSHLVISYAVFCLKKKKKRKETSTRSTKSSYLAAA